MNISLDNTWIMWNVFIVLLNIVALIATIAKPGKNAQTIRAIAIVGAVSFRFWLGVIALAWAVVDFMFPNLSVKMKMPEVKKEKK